MLMFHPEIEQLVEYSASSLHPSVALCISTHVEFCQECRNQLSKMDSIGGVLLDSLESPTVNPALLNSIFQRIDNQQLSSAGTVKMAFKDDDIVPVTLKKLVNYDMDSLRWRSHGPKVKSAELINTDGIKASLIRIKKGTAIPQHGHKGLEYTVVLDGSFSDSTGVYHRGDFIVKKPGDNHAPTAAMDKDCLCLAVLEGAMHFNNGLLNVMNRFIPL